MLANSSVVRLVRFGAVVSILAASSFCGVSVYLGGAKAQENVNSAATIARPHCTETRRQVDLGDGVTFTEITSKSDDGEVWLRLTMIKLRGKLLMTKSWDKIPIGGRKREAMVQDFYCDGRKIAFEIDQHDDRDSHLVALSDKDGLPSQAFDVKENGELVPVQGDRLKKMRENAKLLGDCFKPIVEGAKKGASEPEMKRRVEEAIKKASDGRQDSE